MLTKMVPVQNGGGGMIYVVGGNLTEAEAFARRCQRGDCVPFDSPEALEGLVTPEVILTGTFIARHDATSFYRALKAVAATYRYVR